MNTPTKTTPPVAARAWSLAGDRVAKLQGERLDDHFDPTFSGELRRATLDQTQHIRSLVRLAQTQNGPGGWAERRSGST